MLLVSFVCLWIVYALGEESDETTETEGVDFDTPQPIQKPEPTIPEEQQSSVPQENNPSQITKKLVLSSSDNQTTKSVPPKGKKRSDTLLETIEDHFKKPKMTDDRFDVFGKNVDMKLREIPNYQRIIVEKLINDTMFLAEMGQLTLSHTVSASNPPMINHQGYAYTSHINVPASSDLTSLVDSLSNINVTSESSDNVTLATYFTNCGNLS